jgi:hypothetical protein
MAYEQIGNMNLNGEMMMPYPALDVWQDTAANTIKFVSRGIQFPTTYGDVIFYGGAMPAKPFPIALGYVAEGPYERIFYESNSTLGGAFGEELLAHVSLPLGVEVVYYMEAEVVANPRIVTNAPGNIVETGAGNIVVTE